MRISVIIPALNEAKHIASAVTSAKQAGVWEIFVADGGSKDDTVVAGMGAGAKIVECPPGRAVQQNAAAQHATGEVLLFLHADSRLPTNAVKNITSALSQPANVAGAFHQQIEAPGWIYRCIELGNAWRVRLWSLPYGDQGIFVRREIFERVGGFPQSPLLEDLLLMQQLRRIGQVALIQGPIRTSARRWQQNGVIRQTLKNWWILAAARLGVPLERLRQIYEKT